MKKKILIIIPLVALLCMTVFAIFPSAEVIPEGEYFTDEIGQFTLIYSDGAGECSAWIPLNNNYTCIYVFLSGTATILDVSSRAVAFKISGKKYTVASVDGRDYMKADLTSFSEICLSYSGDEDVDVTVIGYRPKTYEDGHVAGYNEGHGVGAAEASAKYDEGYNEGYTAGESAGYLNGMDKGTKSGYQAGLADGYQNGYDEGVEDGYNQKLPEMDGYQYGYNAGYIAGKLDNSSKDQNDKIKDALDDYADAIDSNEDTLVQGFLAGMWNGATNFVQTLLTGITFSGLSLMNIVATGLAILIAVYIIKMVKG